MGAFCFGRFDQEEEQRAKECLPYLRHRRNVAWKSHNKEQLCRGHNPVSAVGSMHFTYEACLGANASSRGEKEEQECGSGSGCRVPARLFDGKGREKKKAGRTKMKEKLS